MGSSSILKISALCSVVVLQTHAAADEQIPDWLAEANRKIAAMESGSPPTRSNSRRDSRAAADDTGTQEPKWLAEANRAIAAMELGSRPTESPPFYSIYLVPVPECKHFQTFQSNFSDVDEIIESFNRKWRGLHATLCEYGPYDLEALKTNLLLAARKVSFSLNFQENDFQVTKDARNLWKVRFRNGANKQYDTILQELNGNGQLKRPRNASRFHFSLGMGKESDIVFSQPWRQKMLCEFLSKFKWRLQIVVSTRNLYGDDTITWPKDSGMSIDL